MTKKTETTANVAAEMTVTQPPGYKFVSRVAYGDEVVTSDPLKVPNFTGPTATVTIGAAYTKNMGNYESARINVEVSLPCYPIDSEIVRTADHLSELANALLQEQVGLVSS